jgi:hypothetical protein
MADAMSERVPEPTLAALRSLDAAVDEIAPAVASIGQRWSALTSMFNTDRFPSLEDPAEPGNLDAELLEDVGFYRLALKLSALSGMLDPDETVG